MKLSEINAILAEKLTSESSETSWLYSFCRENDIILAELTNCVNSSGRYYFKRPSDLVQKEFKYPFPGGDVAFRNECVKMANNKPMVFLDFDIWGLRKVHVFGFPEN